MIGNHGSVHGGITSVIQQMLSFDWENADIQMRFLPSYKGGNAMYKGFYFLGALKKLKREIRNNRPDIVHIHMSHHGSFERAKWIQKICRKNEIPLIVHLHGSEFAEFYDSCRDKKRKEIASFFQDCDIVITLGKKWKDIVTTIAKDSNIVILNNAVHIPEHIVEQKKNEITVLFLGVLFERKGAADLLKAVKIMADNHVLVNKKFIFNIAGSGPEEDKLRRYCEDNHINEFVRFLGWIDGGEKMRQLKSNQIFVLPSYNEGLPIAILEALSYGMPIVATKVGSVSEAVREGVNGYLVAPGDIEGYVNAFTELFTNYALRSEMGIHSRKIAKERFNEDIYFAQLLNLYQILGTER